MALYTQQEYLKKSLVTMSNWSLSWLKRSTKLLTIVTSQGRHLKATDQSKEDASGSYEEDRKPFFGIN